MQPSKKRKRKKRDPPDSRSERMRGRRLFEGKRRRVREKAKVPSLVLWGGKVLPSTGVIGILIANFLRRKKKENEKEGKNEREMLR